MRKWARGDGLPKCALIRIANITPREMGLARFCFWVKSYVD